MEGSEEQKMPSVPQGQKATVTMTLSFHSFALNDSAGTDTTNSLVVWGPLKAPVPNVPAGFLADGSLHKAAFPPCGSDCAFRASPYIPRSQ